MRLQTTTATTFIQEYHDPQTPSTFDSKQNQLPHSSLTETAYNPQELPAHNTPVSTHPATTPLPIQDPPFSQMCSQAGSSFNLLSPVSLTGQVFVALEPHCPCLKILRIKYTNWDMIISGGHTHTFGKKLQ